MKRRPYWCSKPILFELNLLRFQHILFSNNFAQLLATWVKRLFKKKEKADLSCLLYGTQAWYINEENFKKLETCWIELLREMVNGRWSRLPLPEEAEDAEFRDTDILHIAKINSLRNGTLGWISLNYINASVEQEKRSTQDKPDFAALVDLAVANATPWIVVTRLLTGDLTVMYCIPQNIPIVQFDPNRFWLTYKLRLTVAKSLVIHKSFRDTCDSSEERDCQPVPLEASLKDKSRKILF